MNFIDYIAGRETKEELAPMGRPKLASNVLKYQDMIEGLRQLNEHSLANALVDRLRQYKQENKL